MVRWATKSGQSVKALACEYMRLHEWGSEHYPWLYKWRFEGHRWPGIGQQCPAWQCFLHHHASSFITFIHPRESWIQAQAEVTILNWITATLQLFILYINDLKFSLILIVCLCICTKQIQCTIVIRFLSCFLWLKTNQ